MSEVKLENKSILKKVDLTDVDYILNVENNPTNWKFSGTTIRFSREQIEAFVIQNQTIYTTGQVRFILQELSTGQLVGTVDLFEYDRVQQSVGVGILVDREFRRKGYGLEGLVQISRYAFKTLNIQMIFANIAVDNTASIGLFVRAGFEKIGGQRTLLMDETSCRVYRFELRNEAT